MFFVVMSATDRASYLRSKIELGANNVFHEGAPPDSGFVDEQVSALLGSESIPEPSLAEEDDHPSLDRKQEVRVDAAKRCALMELVHSAPLIESEEIREDFFTYLKEPFEGFGRNTAALRRRTNLAELVFLFDGVEIDNGDIVYHELPHEEFGGSGEEIQLRGISDKVGRIVSGMLTEAAKGAAGAVGALVFNIVIKAIFGDGDNRALIEEIQGVIKDEIDSSEIDKINGRVEGTLQFLTNDYLARKQASDLSNPEERRELLNSLSSYSQEFYTQVMGVLQQPRYARKGMASYLLGSAIHLLITQEQALVDWKTTHPNESSFAATLRANAKRYREHLETTFDAMEKDRLGLIGSKHSPDYTCGRLGCTVSREAWGWWDRGLGVGGKFYRDQDKNGRSPKDKAQAKEQALRSAAYSILAAAAGDPRVNAIPHLRQLEVVNLPG